MAKRYDTYQRGCFAVDPSATMLTLLSLWQKAKSRFAKVGKYCVKICMPIKEEDQRFCIHNGQPRH